MEISRLQEFPHSLQKDWNDLLERSASNFPFLRFEYLANWWQTRGGGEWSLDTELAILIARQSGQLVGIAPFFISNHQGMKRLMLLGSTEISDFLDLIVSKENASEFVTSILSYFKSTLVSQSGIELVDLYNLVEGSLTIEILRDTGVKLTEEPLQQSPVISLPEDWEQYLNLLDKKQRHEIRRKMRRATESDIPVGFYITTEKAHLERDIDAFLSLMEQDPEKKSFLTDSMRTQFQLMMRTTFQSGQLQLAFLTIGGEFAAAYLNFDYLNRIWVYNSGIDKRFMDYSPGWVLLGHLLQWAIEHKRGEFDFMRWNEDYKYKFGAIDRHVVRVTFPI